MADTHAEAESSELVFCHNCENEWTTDEHGLVCPQCSSDIVEIIDPDSDPRDDSQLHDLLVPGHDDQPPPYIRSNAWGGDASDPEEDDIQRVEYGGPGGMRFSSTTYVRGDGPIRERTQFVNGPDIFPQLFSNLLGLTQPQMPDHDRQQRDPYSQTEQTRSPLQEGPFRMGSAPRMQSSIRITTSGFGPGGVRTTNIASDDAMGIIGSILQNLGGAHPGFTGGTGSEGQPAGNPLTFLTQILNPANARSGDAVFTNEALDRVISQLMEQHGGSTAPGPASDAAIAALPKVKVTKERLGENGLAECSICMDNVEVGGEVTELPCKHWFHGDCVGPWLREHDTCPQCRRGITPKDGDADVPRSTGQAPRFWQVSDTDFRPEGTGRASNPASPSAGPSRQPTRQGSDFDGLRSEQERTRRRRRSSSSRSPRSETERSSFMGGIFDRIRGSTSSSTQHPASTSQRRRSRSHSDHSDGRNSRHRREHKSPRSGGSSY